MKRRRLLLFLTGSLCVLAAFIFFRSNRTVQPITRTFPAAGIRKVIIRADQALHARVSGNELNQIQITGLPSGGAKGYHSSDPFWRETPPQEQGLDFVAKQYGDVLVLSTKNEIHYIHHYYFLDKLSIQVPKDITVVREKRKLNGDIAPDLKKP